MNWENGKKRQYKNTAAKGAILLLLMTAFTGNAAASPVTSWDLKDYNQDGLQSDLSFGSSPIPPPTGNSANSFGFSGETGCVNASNGDSCDPILFDSGAIATSVFTSGFNLNGTGVVLPKTTGAMSADIAGGVLSFSSLPFAIFQPGPSVGIDVLLLPGAFPVFGSSTNTTPDFSFLTVEDLTSLGNDQYGVVVRWIHQGPSCLGCFDRIEARVRLEGVMTVVPIPAAIWFFVTGIITLFGVNGFIKRR